VNSPSQLSCQGQSVGRCITRCLAERARRAGTAISCLRIVAVVALAWNTDAMAPAARVRLNAIAANTNQALLAANKPEAGVPQLIRPLVHETFRLSRGKARSRAETACI